ncbi:cupin domain-containing protein [Sinorhizobium fredii]|uniref:cupin domain-containing protein n=1 Tax=Rhizobium fredii TaxID=380 RepID=UPI00069468E9|nr:cupin domain-containing protein [Sinorhizobium fredii]WOS65590.1 cupin domain-containing protein [Sinorhizobium fredii GR64]
MEASFPEGFGPPLHVHHCEDEAFYVLEGKIRFLQGDTDFVAGPGTFVWGPRGVPHAFKVEPSGARALVMVTPGEKSGSRCPVSIVMVFGVADPSAQ